MVKKLPEFSGQHQAIAPHHVCACPHWLSKVREYAKGWKAEVSGCPCAQSSALGTTEGGDKEDKHW